MKRLVLFVFLLPASALFLSTNTYARKQGQDKIDSMLTDLKTVHDDTLRVMIFSQISFTYSSMDPEKGLKYGTDALNLSKEINWERGTGYAQYYRGSSYLAQAMFPEALNDYLASLKYFEKVGDKRKMAGLLSNIGSIYGYQQKNEKAVEYFLRALKINREINPKSNFVVANLGNLGVIYFNQKIYQKALEYNLPALNLSIENGYMDMLPNGYATCGGIYVALDSVAKGIYHLNMAVQTAAETGNMEILGVAYSSRGSVILSLLTNDKYRWLIDSLYNGNKQSALADAKRNLDSATALLSETGDLNQLSSTYEHLARLEEYSGHYKAALEYDRLFKKINDSVFNADKNEKILQSAMQYDFDKKEAATKAEQDKKNIMQRNIRNSISAGLAGALIFLGVVYRQRNKIKLGKKRSDELLLNILPEEVAEELKAKGSADARQFDDVTVMFTDFKGFTQIAEKLSPSELVAEIHTCFKAFDEIIHKHNIEKIKTIGDAYMCVGGLPVANTTHAYDVVKAALEIRQFIENHIQQRRNAGKEVFEIRIGIHTGTVVAGIVGVKKFAYDIWGDTVNTASRMESSGEPGEINISGSTYALVKDQFACAHRGKIAAKNKGEIDMCFVSRSLDEG